MQCRLVDKFILDYCENNFPPDLTREIEAHLQECPMCSKAVSLCKAENSILYNLEQFEPSPDFTAKVMANIKSSTMVNQPSQIMKKAKIYYKILPMVATVAAVILLICTVNLSGVFNTNSDMIANKESSIESQQTVQKDILLKQEFHIAQNEMIADRAIEEQASVEKEDNYSENREVASNNKEKFNAANSQTATSNISNKEKTNTKQEQELNLLSTYNEQETSQGMLTMASAPEEESPIDLQIQNVPEQYTLVDIINNQSNSITFCYADASKETTLDITITKVLAKEPKTLEKGLGIVLSSRNQQLHVSETNPSPLNTLSWELDKDNNSYIISIQSNLPKEDLVVLYSQITFTN